MRSHLLALLLLPALVSSAASERPNLLLVVADDVAERDVDGIPTPHLDALAARGLRFRRAYGNPTCSPARWSLVFGQYHAVDAGLSCQGGSPRLAPDPRQASLPRMLRLVGYRTALFGKWHLGFHPDSPPVAPDEEPRWQRAAQVHGFELWRAGMPANVTSCGGRSYTRWTRVDDGASARSRQYNTDAITEAALAWIEERDGDDEPWFAMVAYQAPHGPFHEPPGHEGEAGRGRSADRRAYELMLASFDAALGRLLASIDATRTVVLVVGDNGTPESVPGPGQRAGTLKGTTYEDGIRVPMVWAGPGVVAGRESSALVHFVDVLPTVAEWLDVTLDVEGAGLDGRSLVRALLDPGTSVHERVWCGIEPRNTSRPADYAVVTPRFKYRECGGEVQLFDLGADPEERLNLAGAPEHAERRATLAAFLEAHRPR